MLDEDVEEEGGEVGRGFFLPSGDDDGEGRELELMDRDRFVVLDEEVSGSSSFSISHISHVR